MFTAKQRGTNPGQRRRKSTVAVGGSRRMVDRQMDARTWEGRVGGVSDGGQWAWKRLHAGDGSFQGVSISMTSPGGPSVGGDGDIISLFDGCSSGLVMVSTTFQLATGKRWVLTLLALMLAQSPGPGGLGAGPGSGSDTHPGLLEAVGPPAVVGVVRGPLGLLELLPQPLYPVVVARR